ncbi:hypothetical protein GS887_27670 [Rhodococcus hoagii]|nr:hypothetical protein [Prescottella equi]
MIERSGVVETIETLYEQERLPGGHDPSGIIYTIRAVLVAALVRIIGCTPPTYAGIPPPSPASATSSSLRRHG